MSVNLSFNVVECCTLNGRYVRYESSDLFSICCPEILLSCEEVVSPHYFSSRLQCDLYCYICGAFGSLKPISEEQKRSFQTVHPICTDCSDNGKKERTKGPRFSGKKPTASQADI